jgi:hypothetical protein
VDKLELAMPRHLTRSQIEIALNLVRPIEQFLGAASEGCVAWLEIRRSDDLFQLWRFDVCDDGSEDFVDLY